MPQLAAITILDGAATPASHVFAPVTTNGWLSKLAERVGVNPTAFPVITLSVREPASKASAYKVEEKIVVPVMGTVNGVVVKIRESSALVTYLFAPDSTEQERKDIRRYVVNLNSDASVTTMVEKLEPQY